jgi:hypothetical protein
MKISNSYLKRSAASSGPGFAAPITLFPSTELDVTETEVLPPFVETRSRMATNCGFATTTEPEENFLVRSQGIFVFYISEMTIQHDVHICLKNIRCKHTR